MSQLQHRVRYSRLSVHTARAPLRARYLLEMLLSVFKFKRQIRQLPPMQLATQAESRADSTDDDGVGHLQRWAETNVPGAFRLTGRLHLSVELTPSLLSLHPRSAVRLPRLKARCVQEKRRLRDRLEVAGDDVEEAQARRQDLGAASTLEVLLP